MSAKKFRRDRSIPLADDANNPGALNAGLWSRRYGAKQSYTFRGNTTAVFPTRGHGVAALMDLILNRRGYTVRQYIMGGGGIRKDRSYSGGQDYSGYLAAMVQKRVDPDEVVDGSIAQLKRLVAAHAFAEGAVAKSSKIDFAIALALLQERSPNIAGTEVESTLVA